MNANDYRHFHFDFESTTDRNWESHGHIEEFKCRNYSIARIYDYYSGDLAGFDSYEAIVIRYTLDSATQRLISSIRARRDRNIYLKPVFIEIAGTPSEGLHLLLSDGLIESIEKVRGVAPVITHLIRRSREIQLVQFERYDDAILYALLAFLYTRSIEQIKPRLDRTTRVGFYYPILSDLDAMTKANASHLSILSKAERTGYLLGRFYEVSYLCNQCSGGFLHYREVCSSCHSANLKTHEMVHHFRCAHVAPIVDYLKNEDGDRSLICPKCDHILKHIGVDYDKPSNIHHCQTCEHQFQNYAIRAKCTDCGHDQGVEHLVKKELKTYDVSEKAITALREGKLSDELQENPNQVAGAISWDLFTRNLEYARSNETARTGFVIRLRLLAIDKIEKQMGSANRKKLLEEVIDIIKSSQKGYDYRTLQSPIIYFTLLKVSESEADEIAARTVFLLNHLFSDNLRIKSASIEYSVLSLSGVYEAALADVNQ